MDGSLCRLGYEARRLSAARAGVLFRRGTRGDSIRSTPGLELPSGNSRKQTEGQRERYAWVTLVPALWLLVTTLTAGVEKIFHSDPRIGFLALAHKFDAAAAQGIVLAPAKSIEEMQRVAFNNTLDAVVCGFFVVLVLAMDYERYTTHMTTHHSGARLLSRREFCARAIERTYHRNGPRCC